MSNYFKTTALVFLLLLIYPYYYVFNKQFAQLTFGSTPYDPSYVIFNDDEVKDIYAKIQKATGEGDDYPLFILNDDTINAYATSEGVHIYRGLIKQLDNVDELALVLGHETSHIMLGHVFRTDNQDIWAIRKMELQADKYGAFLAQRAGYDICNGRLFFTLLKNEFGDSQDQDHPDMAYRYDQVTLPSCK